MQVGDLVRAKAAPTGRPVGIIMRLEVPAWSSQLQYWVELCGKHRGPYPFLENQLELINASR